MNWRWVSTEIFRAAGSLLGGSCGMARPNPGAESFVGSAVCVSPKQLGHFSCLWRNGVQVVHPRLRAPPQDAGIAGSGFSCCATRRAPFDACSAVWFPTAAGSDRLGIDGFHSVSHR